MHLKRFLFMLAVVALISAPSPLNRTSGTAVGQGSGPAITPAGPQKPVTLRDRLVVGLRAMSKSDLAFVDNVVARVNSGRLPVRLVDQTFFWARKRAASAGSRRPIIYFRPALVARAKRIGVTL